MSAAKERIRRSIDVMDEKTAELAYDILERVAALLDHDNTFITRQEQEVIDQGRSEIESGEFVALEQFEKGARS
jgi:hypothetical protein